MIHDYNNTTVTMLLPITMLLSLGGHNNKNKEHR